MADRRVLYYSSGLGAYLFNALLCRSTSEFLRFSEHANFELPPLSGIPPGHDSTMTVTLLLPIRIDRWRRVSDLERFLAIGLPSLHRYMAKDCVAELLVVAPPEDLGRVRKRLAGSAQFPVRVIDETRLCPSVAHERGWYKQQIIKLAAAELIHTPWYLTLDADVVCVRYVNDDFLFPDGRAIWQREPVRAHPEWWEGSREVLRSSRKLDLDQAVIGVTPALMHSASARDLLVRLAALDRGCHWAATLVHLQHLKWTDHSLYWTHLVEVGGVEHLYGDSSHTPYGGDSVWSTQQLGALTSARLDAVFAADSDHGFFIFQSNLELPLETPASLLRPLMGLPATLSPSARIRVAWHWVGWKLRGVKSAVGRRVRRLNQRTRVSP